jgi:sortase A
VPLTDKRWVRDTKRSGYAVFETGRTVRRRRPRIGLFILILFLAPLVILGGLRAHYLFSGASEETNGGPSERVDTPSVEQEPSGHVDTPPVEHKPKARVVKEDDGRVATAPDDPTLYLTVPRLGLYDNTVRNDRSEEAMGLGAIKLPKTDFPWQRGPTNTYIVCHRLGFPGTESFNQCLNLPSMQKGDEVILKDANGTVYRYRVSEFLQVTPYDMWVTQPVAGKEIVSLQTCIEDLDDFFTMGPNWSARMVVRAVRIG